MLKFVNMKGLFFLMLINVVMAIPMVNYLGNIEDLNQDKDLVNSLEEIRNRRYSANNNEKDSDEVIMTAASSGELKANLIAIKSKRAISDIVSKIIEEIEIIEQIHLIVEPFLAQKLSENMELLVVVFASLISCAVGGISPVHDIKAKLNSKDVGERFVLNSPHNALKHLDDSITKATKNVTQNAHMEQTLYQIAKDLVSAILSKLEVQDKITRITREALEAPGKNKGISAIETRRILDYISRTLSGNILTITRDSTEPELHRLVYGLAQIAAEVSIVAALKDNTYSDALSKKQSIDMNLRKKRDVEGEPEKVELTTAGPNLLYQMILNKTSSPTKIASNASYFPESPFSILNEKLPVHVLNSVTIPRESKGFLNQTVLDMENNQRNRSANNTEIVPIVMDGKLNATHYVIKDTPESSDADSTGELLQRDNIYRSALSPDIVAELELDQTPADEEKNEKRTKLKLEKLEAKAKKAILFAGDVAYLTAASVVAMRRALTASIEVQMSARFAKTGMANHQELMMNLAKTAAQQAGKEARIAASKSTSCDKVLKLALKYTAQSHGGDLNHVANRIVMDTLSLATLAKSMAFVSSDIAINSLYQATDIKTPS